METVHKFPRVHSLRSAETCLTEVTGVLHSPVSMTRAMASRHVLHDPDTILGSGGARREAKGSRGKERCTGEWVTWYAPA